MRYELADEKTEAQRWRAMAICWAVLALLTTALAAWRTFRPPVPTQKEIRFILRLESDREGVSPSAALPKIAASPEALTLEAGQ